jgi:penicillin-binding protein 2
VESCDVFFYEVGKRLGIERLAHYARELGLGNPTGIDLPGEEAGLVPSPDWKQRVMKEPWYAGETISVAIGQGALTVTPLQLAHTLGGIASGGVFVRPRLLLDPTEGQFTRRVELKQETVAQLTDALWGVVNENGTGTSARLPQVEVAGKTGTAQLLSYDALRRAGKQSASKLKDNAWFVGLSPRRNPEIVVAVLVEQGEHGGVSAAPLARDVIKAYFEKKSASPRTYAEMRPIPPRPQEP